MTVQHLDDGTIRFNRMGGQFLEISPDGWMRVRFAVLALRSRTVNLNDLRSAKRTFTGTSGIPYAVLKDHAGNTARFNLLWFKNGYEEVARRIADAVVGVEPDGDKLFAELISQTAAHSLPAGADGLAVAHSALTVEAVTRMLGRPPTLEELADLQNKVDARTKADEGEQP